MFSTTKPSFFRWLGNYEKTIKENWTIEKAKEEVEKTDIHKSFNKINSQITQIAKVKLAFFLEYLNAVCGLSIGLIVLLIGYLFSRPHKPIVLDFSKRKK